MTHLTFRGKGGYYNDAPNGVGPEFSVDPAEIVQSALKNGQKLFEVLTVWLIIICKDSKVSLSSRNSLISMADLLLG